MIWAAVAAITYGVTRGLLSRTRVSVDEAWIVVVTKRLRSGAVLYRDVFFGAGPTAAWVLLGATRLLGTEVRALRTVNATVSTVVTVSALVLAQELDAPPIALVALWLTSTIANAPTHGSENLYANLSRAGLLVALTAFVIAPLDIVALAIGGAAAGVAVTSKYNVGALGSLGLLGLLVWSRAGPTELLVVGAAGAAVVAASLAPVALRGAWASMLARLGRNKRSYLEHGVIPLRATLRTSIDGARGRSSERRARIGFVLAIAHGLACVSTAVIAVTACVVATVREGSLSRPVVVAAVCLLVWMAHTWPRADATHLRSGLALAALAAVISTSDGVVGGALGAWSILSAVLVARILLRPPLARGTSAGWRGIPVRWGEREAIALAEVERLAGREVFLLGSEAPFAYVSSDIVNPTPFDYPAASTFGPDGQDEVVERLRRGEITWVAEVGLRHRVNAPDTITAFVDRHSEVVFAGDGITLRRVTAPALRAGSGQDPEGAGGADLPEAVAQRALVDLERRPPPVLGVREDVVDAEVATERDAP